MSLHLIWLFLQYLYNIAIYTNNILCFVVFSDQFTVNLLYFSEMTSPLLTEQANSMSNPAFSHGEFYCVLATLRTSSACWAEKKTSKWFNRKLQNSHLNGPYGEIVCSRSRMNFIYIHIETTLTLKLDIALIFLRYTWGDYICIWLSLLIIKINGDRSTAKTAAQTANEIIYRESKPGPDFTSP